MNITFTRTGECTYATQAARGDGVTLQVPSYDRTSLLPHDLAHYVVERELGLQHGFWGCVARGAMFSGMTVVSGRQPPRPAERSRTILREAGQQGTRAEVLVGVFLGILRAGREGDEAAVARVKDAWEPARVARGEPLGADEIRRVCTALRETLLRWQSLAVGQILVVWWPPLRTITRSSALTKARRRS